MKIDTQKATRLIIPLCMFVLISNGTLTHATLVSLKPAAQASADTLNATDVVHKLKEQQSDIKTGEIKTLSALIALFAKGSTYEQAEKIIGQAYNHAGIESAALKAAHDTIEMLSSHIAALQPTLSSPQQQITHINDMLLTIATLKTNRAALHREYLLDPIKRTAKNVVDSLENMVSSAIPLIVQKLKNRDSQKTNKADEELHTR